MTNDQLLTPKQVGLMLALSPRQIFRLNSSGRIPAPVKIVGATRWKSSDIDRWIEMDCPDHATFEAQQGGRDV